MYAAKELPTGKFDVIDEHGNSVAHKFGGVFNDNGLAGEAARMLNVSDQVIERIEQINQTLREAQNGI